MAQSLVPRSVSGSNSPPDTPIPATRTPQASLRRDHSAAVSRLALSLKRSGPKPPPSAARPALPREMANLGLPAPAAPAEPVKEVVYGAAPPEDDVSDDTEDEGEEADDEGEEAAVARRAGREARRERVRAKEAAEEALLDAIRDRTPEGLAAAIEGAEAAGHSGEHPDGKPWMSAWRASTLF